MYVEAQIVIYMNLIFSTHKRSTTVLYQDHSCCFWLVFLYYLVMMQMFLLQVFCVNLFIRVGHQPGRWANAFVVGLQLEGLQG